ncbi:KPN_02809 family neutral zinc metallopeptidase [Acidaminobacter hydrogenoformans]|uniref:Metalloprotease n=1 Tax=Acidaminobacter hydrogenoformans DSM 2784 TaxID=1120920 RepID=A0A1G5S175_9FIRM|nr:neutral zinc metallopeptidase [Acidaminobacter hydrogenoformans]SCZ79670.1 hypothetical protein SAMN03080599_01885 [Acidaminobacter hydrogenoformans DSM 2784]
MRYKGRRGSSNVEDRRGMGGGGKKAIGGSVGILLIIIVALLGGDPSQILGATDILGPGSDQAYEATAEEQELAEFVSVVLADTEVVWNQIFEDAGMDYEEPGLVLYTGTVESACGTAGSSTGPFYCPGDNKVYIDLSFYEDLRTRFNAPGDFAMAYVIAHEVGHHVQNQLGILKQVQDLRTQLSEKDYNEYQVRLELQADYLAGVWANHVKGMGYLEEGDLEEALNAASAVGDDRIQMQSRGYVVPDSFTHGTSEQRSTWFYKGFKAGDLSEGDTFNANDL